MLTNLFFNKVQSAFVYVHLLIVQYQFSTVIIVLIDSNSHERRKSFDDSFAICNKMNLSIIFAVVVPPGESTTKNMTLFFWFTDAAEIDKFAWTVEIYDSPTLVGKQACLLTSGSNVASSFWLMAMIQMLSGHDILKRIV